MNKKKPLPQNPIYSCFQSAYILYNSPPPPSLRNNILRIKQQLQTKMYYSIGERDMRYRILLGSIYRHVYAGVYMPSCSTPTHINFVNSIVKQKSQTLITLYPYKQYVCVHNMYCTYTTTTRYI